MNDTTIERPSSPQAGSARLARRMERGAAFLGSEVAIMAGAMSWVSERNLVAAMSNAGGFGVIACGAMTVDLLDKEIAARKEKLKKQKAAAKAKKAVAA